MSLYGSAVLDNGIKLDEVNIKIDKITFSYSDINDSTATNISEVVIDVEVYKDELDENSSLTRLRHSCTGEQLNRYFSDYDFDLEYTNPLILAYDWLINEIYPDTKVIGE